MEGSVTRRLLVRGEIHFEPSAPSFHGATAYVRLEDVTLADAPARTVAEQILHDVSHGEAASRPVQFALYGDAPLDERARYSLRVHVSPSGSPELRAGDYVTMESYPVSAVSLPANVDVVVYRID